VSELGRVPPNDMDAEGVVLGTIIADQSAYDRVQPILRPEHFYADANRRIFEAVADLVSTGKPADLVTVVGWLRDRERLEQSGGAAYVAHLFDSPFAANVEEHARRVVEKWRLRSLIHEGQSIVSEAYACPLNVSEFVQSAEARMYAAAGEVRERITSETAGEVIKGCLAEIDRRYRGDSPRGLSSGFKALDVRIGGLREGRTYVCAGRPGMGKTSFLLQAARSVAKSEVENRGVYIASLEMPRNQLGDRFIAQEATLDTRKVELGLLTKAEWPGLSSSASEVGSWPMVIEDEPGLTIAGIRSSLRRAVRRLRSECGVGLGLVGIDYFQLIGTRDQRWGGSTNDLLEAVSAGIVGIAKEFKVPVILLSQLNRECEKRPGKRPQLSDLRGSGALEQDAHTIIFFFREDVYRDPAEAKDRKAEFIIAKARGGRCGTVSLGYLEYCTKFVPQESDDEQDELARYADELGSFAEQEDARHP
jgi:replicative DNA helicase